MQNYQSNATLYDQWAPDYDTMPNSTIAIDEVNFPKLWAELPPSRVLEIGCGTGRHTKKLVRSGHNILAIDQSKQMLEIAKAQELSGVEYICGDIFTLELPKVGFDFAIMSLVLEHLPNPQLVFEIIFGALKTGGSFFLSEIHPNRMQNGSGARFIDKETQEEVRMVSFIHGLDEIRTKAQNAGFHIVSEIECIASPDFAAQNLAWEKYINTPMTIMWHFQKP